MDDAISKAVSLVRKSIAELDPSKEAITPPYDPVPFALALGAKDVRPATLGYDGHVSGDGENLVVEYDRDVSSSQRRRFTIAHEVGHLLLWKAIGSARKLPAYRSPRGSEIETICNKIAAEVLAPRREVRVLWKNHISENGIRHRCKFIHLLSTYFDVSVSFAAVRFTELSSPSLRTAYFNSFLTRFEWAHGSMDRADLLNRIPALISKQPKSGSTTYMVHRAIGVGYQSIEWARVADGLFLIALEG